MVWVAIVATGGFASRLFELLALTPNGYCDVRARGQHDCPRPRAARRGGTFVPGVVDGAYWQLVTSMFTHVQFWHIGFNMLALWVLGPQLELAVGRARFLALYFLSGLAGSALVYWAGPEFGGTHGASGAIFGLMGALLIVAIKVRGDVRGILTWIGINFVVTFLFGPQDLLAGPPRRVHRRAGRSARSSSTPPAGPRRTTFQVAGMAGVGLLIALAIVPRTARPVLSRITRCSSSTGLCTPVDTVQRYGPVRDRRCGGLDTPGRDSFLARAGCSTTVDAVGVEASAFSEAHSQRVAKVKPTAMKAMPTIRLYWPRSSKNGTSEMSLLKM